MRLLMQFLTAQWQSGGSLGPGLSAIAVTVRDRIALTRRIQGQSAEARFSVFGIVLVIYGIAALAWVNNRGKVEAFMASDRLLLRKACFCGKAKMRFKYKGSNQRLPN